MATDPAQLLLLLTWMSPAFPTGAFAYSHGLEWAIAEGHVKTRDETRAWIAALVTGGSAWNDAVLFARCWDEDTDELNALALALASSKERYEETVALGRSFQIAVSHWNAGTTVEESGDIAHPIAAARACIALGLPRDAALIAYLQAFAQNLVSVAVRLVPLGQTAGLEILRDLSTVIAATAARAPTGEIGSKTIFADIAAMRHETLETRIFRT